MPANPAEGAKEHAVAINDLKAPRWWNTQSRCWLGPNFLIDREHELLPWEWKLLRKADKPVDQQAA